MLAHLPTYSTDIYTHTHTHTRVWHSHRASSDVTWELLPVLLTHLLNPPQPTQGEKCPFNGSQWETLHTKYQPSCECHSFCPLFFHVSRSRRRSRRERWMYRWRPEWCARDLSTAEQKHCHHWSKWILFCLFSSVVAHIYKPMSTLWV